MKPSRLALAALALTLTGCSGLALSGFTIEYGKGDETISATAHFQASGKQVVRPSK